MSIQSPLLQQIQNLRHGFGTREEPIPSFSDVPWTSRPQWKQVHGVATAQITHPNQLCGEVDALWTRAVELPIAVVTADCVPILFAHRAGSAIAAVHAGWRGTRARITEKLWEQLKASGEEPKNWVACIGPSIGPCCYEVSPELAETFQTEFGELPKRDRRKNHLDLGEINRQILEGLGLSAIDRIEHCTRCSPSPQFFSYRGGDRDSRQYSVLSLLRS